jgi:hypothetical protein
MTQSSENCGFDELFYALMSSVIENDEDFEDNGIDNGLDEMFNEMAAQDEFFESCNIRGLSIDTISNITTKYILDEDKKRKICLYKRLDFDNVIFHIDNRSDEEFFQDKEEVIEF